MRKVIVLVFLLALLRGFGVTQTSAQEKSYITVRGSEQNEDVLIPDVLKGSKAYPLTYSQGAPGCPNLRNGDYLMLELPKNFGMYECRNLEASPEFVAASDTVAPEKDEKLGEYRLVEK